MTLPPYIKKAPLWWKYFPYLNILRGCLFFNKIYLRNDIYLDLLKESPEPYNYSVYLHEMKHMERMKEVGMLKFGFQYIFSRKARLNEELIAIKAQIDYLKPLGIKYDIEKAAKALSGWAYFWSTNYEDAKFQLENLLR